jgi:hypothetical protein
MTSRTLTGMGISAGGVTAALLSLQLAMAKMIIAERDMRRVCNE